MSTGTGRLLRKQEVLVDLDVHSAGQVGAVEPVGETTQAEGWVKHFAIENGGGQSHTSDGQATPGKTGFAEDGPCPYRARLNQAITDYNLQCSHLPESQRALLTASYRADFHQTYHEAWDAVLLHLGSQSSPSVFQRGGRAVYMQPELAAHTTHLAIRPHTPDTMNAATSKAIYWYDGWKTEPVATGELTPPVRGGPGHRHYCH